MKLTTQTIDRFTFTHDNFHCYKDPIVLEDYRTCNINNVSNLDITVQNGWDHNDQYSEYDENCSVVHSLNKHRTHIASDECKHSLDNMCILKGDFFLIIVFN